MIFRLFEKIKWLKTRGKGSYKFIFFLIFLGVVLSILSTTQALVTKSLLDSTKYVNREILYKWIAILAVVLLSQVILRSIQSITVTYSSEFMKNNLQKQIFNHIIKTKWLEASKFHSVEFLNRLTSDSSTITNTLINSVPEIISLIVMLITSLLALFYIAPFMALAFIIIIPLLMILSKFYGNKMKFFYKKNQEIEVAYNSFLQESFANNLIIKTFNLEGKRIEKAEAFQKEKINLALKKSYFNSISNVFLGLSSYIMFFLVFSWGAINISKGNMVFGTLAAMMQLLGGVQGPLYGLPGYINQIVSVIGAIERIKEVESIPLEDKGTLEVVQNLEDNTRVNDNYNLNGEDTLASNKFSIKIKNIDFSYIENKKVLDNFSFEGESGDIVALVGSSGKGKTTIIRALLSLIYPNKGEILINNKKLMESDRGLISYVPQGNTLFSGSIRDNLVFGDKDINNEDIELALKQASALEFVKDLENNIETVIGEKALGLSEGQAQRLAIARALLRKRPILLLDEATSALDVKTEIEILQAIKSIKYKPLCIIVTHRPAVLEICNKIYKL